MRQKRRATSEEMYIIEELEKIFGKGRVRIDYDIMSEPCIFFAYKGPHDVVYKLTPDGRYSRNAGHYIVQARDAIIEYIKQRDLEIYNAEKERQYQQNMNTTRERVAQGNLSDMPTGEEQDE
jgi:hypothetical protein